MKRRTFLQMAGMSSLACMHPAILQAANANEQPNIVYILADDLGYGDLQCYNPSSKIPTPNLDRLASQGMQFTNAHAGSAVCTPTRYGILTGRYSWRTRMKSGVLNGYSSHLIDPERMTVASFLKDHGYNTACIGKWHLGLDLPFKDKENKEIDDSKPIQNAPPTYGFDYSFIIPASLDFPPYVYIENDQFFTPITETQERQSFPAFLRKGPRGKNFKAIETMDTLLLQSINYIEKQARQDNRFFLYFPLTAPHKPALPAKRFQDDTELGPYGDFITQVDWTVGQVMETLERAGIQNNTLIIFTSDNGSYMYELEDQEKDHTKDATVQGYHPSHHQANSHWRGTKADIYEGGHRIPFIARWPGRISANSERVETICLTDLMATCASIVGDTLPNDAGEDSFSILPFLRGEQLESERPAVVHHSANGTFAIREGKWKLILSSGSGGRQEPRGKPGSKPYQLYNMEDDPNETNNLIEEHPRKASRLEYLLKSFQENGRSMPVR